MYNTLNCATCNCVARCTNYILQAQCNSCKILYELHAPGCPKSVGATCCNCISPTWTMFHFVQHVATTVKIWSWLADFSFRQQTTHNDVAIRRKFGRYFCRNIIHRSLIFIKYPTLKLSPKLSRKCQESIWQYTKNRSFVLFFIWTSTSLPIFEQNLDQIPENFGSTNGLALTSVRPENGTFS